MSDATHPNPKDSNSKVPLRIKLAYGMGNAGVNLMANGINNLANFVFNIGLGVNPALIGIALSLPRLWEAITDPFMGSISDNYRSRYGRRRPFMFIGAFLSAFLFAIIWWVPRTWGHSALFYYLLATSILFWTAYTIYSIPFFAMGFEITDDQQERVKVMGYGAVLSTIFGFGLAWVFALVKLDVFHDIVDGGKYVSLGLAVIMLIFGLIPVFFGRENYSNEVQRQEKVPLIKGLRESLSNKPFMLIVYTVVFMLIGIMSIGTIGNYLNIYYVYGGAQKPASVMQGWANTSYMVASLIASFLAPMLTARFGKKKLLLAFLIIAFVGALSKWFCYTPTYPVLQLLPNMLIGSGFAVMWMLTSSMTMDTCDLDELINGTRREGTFCAANAWVQKIGTSFAFYLSGVTLNIAGFDIARGGAQTAHAILMMRILAVSVPALATFIAIVLIAKYPITEKRARETREALDARKQSKEALPLESELCSQTE
ncbi:MAG: MFS transporter [Armatimonadota bacterium]|nr:MFS transporter [bacterium]